MPGEREAGAATVELALLIPLVLLLLMAVIEVAVVARVQIELINGAREGARAAAVSPDPADAVAAVEAALGDASVDARIAVTRPQVVGEPARVSVALRHQLGSFLFGGTSVELTGRAAMRVER